MLPASPRLFVYAVPFLLAGCALLGPGGSGGDDGTSGSTGGSGGSGGDEGVGGSGCETKVGCQSCTACAAKSICDVEVQRCLANPTCAQIDQCVADCGNGPTCTEVCRAQNLAGTEDYDKATACVYCEACPRSCKPEAIAMSCEIGEGGAGGK